MCLPLAQAGEFGFVLLTLGAGRGLVSPQWVSPVLACMVLSMLATPFIVMKVVVSDHNTPSALKTCSWCARTRPRCR